MAIETKEYVFDYPEKGEIESVIELYKEDVHYFGEIDGEPCYHINNTTVLFFNLPGLRIQRKGKLGIIGYPEEIEKTRKNLEEKLKIKLERRIK
jgi:hypothetical protein